MKSLFLIAVSFSLALLIGCQENMINEPTGVLIKRDPGTTAFNQGSTTKILKLNYDLTDPGFGSCQLMGKVTYTHQVLSGSMGPVAFKRVSVQIHMQSDLEYLSEHYYLEGRIDSKSDDAFYLNEDGLFMLEKTYRISNRKDVVVLVQYHVTEEDISVSYIRIVQIES